MELQTVDQLVERLRSNASPKRMAVAAAGETHTLEATLMAYREGLVIPKLFGDEADIRRILQELGSDPDEFEIIDASDEKEAAQKAVRAVHDGEGDLLMKGMIQTGDLMRAVIDKEYGLLEEGGVISLVTICEINYYKKLLLLTDSGIVRDPTLEQKKAIIENAVRVMRAYGVEKPKVAAVCAVETVNPKMPETVDAAALAEMSRNGQLKDCLVEGPLSMDIAMNELAAKYKGVESEVAGHADILLWPNVLTGNIAIKAMGCVGGMKNAVAFAVGAKVPLVINSRGTSKDAKYLSILGAAAAS